MNWIVIEKFTPNLEEHLKLIYALSQDQMLFFVRKEFMEFEELGEKEQCELIEENYEIFKEALLYFNNKDIKKAIDERIVDIAKQIKIVDSRYENKISNILKILEQREYKEYLNQVKHVIMNGVLEDYRAKEKILHPNNYAFKTSNNESHRFYGSNGELERECNYFEWYELRSIEDVKSFLQDNNFNYNLMLVKTENTNVKYEYYINFYEGTEYTLAVKDNKGNFVEIFEDNFKGTYLIENNIMVDLD